MMFKQVFALTSLCAFLAACSSSGHRAPVEEHGIKTHKNEVKSEVARKKSSREKDWRPQTHVVQKGDTLYSIAFNYGFDYHELAELNGIKDPNIIQIGQEIRLFPAATTAAIRPVEATESKPLQPVIKDQPKVVKYPYSEEAVGKIDNVQQPVAVVAKTDASAKAEVKPKPETKTEPKPEIKHEVKPETVATVDDEEDALEWAMPTKGKVVADFSEAANRKGIDISGKQGQAIFASAPGKVVYSGSGLRGYGKLIIIKHNKTFLSAYAHNDQVLVKEGQTITRGQKIAEMGNTDADQVKLHFEVRRLGKPVDPAKYLPLGKS